MDITELYHFLFESYAGVGILIAIGLVLSLIVSFVLEGKTRRLYKDRPSDDDSGWISFDEDEDDN